MHRYLGLAVYAMVAGVDCHRRSGRDGPLPKCGKNDEDKGEFCASCGINLKNQTIVSPLTKEKGFPIVKVIIAAIMVLTIGGAACSFIGKPSNKQTTEAIFRGNLQRTGVFLSPGVPELSGLKWSFKTDGGVESSPAIASGVVYVGSSDENLYAVDAQTGQQKWSFKTGGPVVSSPTVAGGVVYFGSWDGNLYALY